MERSSWVWRQTSRFSELLKSFERFCWDLRSCSQRWRVRILTVLGYFLKNNHTWWNFETWQESVRVQTQSATTVQYYRSMTLMARWEVISDYLREILLDSAVRFKRCDHGLGVASDLVTASYISSERFCAFTIYQVLKAAVIIPSVGRLVSRLKKIWI